MMTSMTLPTDGDDGNNDDDDWRWRLTTLMMMTANDAGVDDD